MTQLSDDAVNRLVTMGIDIPVNHTTKTPTYKDLRAPIEDLTDSEKLSELLMVMRMVADTLEEIGSSPMGKALIPKLH
jgi:hypothetical protein